MSKYILKNNKINFSNSRSQLDLQKHSYQVTKVLEFQLQPQSFQWIFRTSFLKDGLTGSLAIQGTLKSILQQHSSKASVLSCSAFFMVQLSHPYITTRKAIALTLPTFVSKVMSLLFDILSKFVITFLPFAWALGFSLYFLIGGKLLYNVLVFARQQHESVITAYASPPSWASLLSPQLTPLGHHRVLGGAPCFI